VVSEEDLNVKVYITYDGQTTSDDKTSLGTIKWIYCTESFINANLCQVTTFQYIKYNVYYNLQIFNEVEKIRGNN